MQKFQGIFSEGWARFGGLEGGRGSGEQWIFGLADSYLKQQFHIWISKSMLGSGNSFLDQQIHNWISKSTLFSLCMIQVVNHEHLDPGHTHSYNAARHAGDQWPHILSIDLQMAQLRGPAKNLCHIDTMNCTQVTLQVSAALVMIAMRSQGLTTTTSGRLLRFSYLPFW